MQCDLTIIDLAGLREISCLSFVCPPQIYPISHTVCELRKVLTGCQYLGQVTDQCLVSVWRVMLDMI